MPAAVSDAPFIVHAPQRPGPAIVLDSPHSGTTMPDDFGAAVTPAELRDGEDCFVDRLWLPAVDKGIPLLAAQFARTYIDANRHAGDIDLELLDAAWPHAHVPSGKVRIGKALIWRTLDDGRAIYARRLSVAEVRSRIARCHAPYHAALRDLLDAAHARHGVVWHLNCHSMNALSGAMGEGGAGQRRADIVLGDRDGTSCDPSITEFVRALLAGLGCDVAVNRPFKGVELVRAYSDPAAGRHSLQIEVNKRLYMDAATLQPNKGFEPLHRDLMRLLDALVARPQRAVEAT